MADYKAELERRRENGRLAQSAFQARQAEARKRMIEENTKLKKAVEHILLEVQEGDRPALRRLVSEAAKVAGLQTNLATDEEAFSPRPMPTKERKKVVTTARAEVPSYNRIYFHPYVQFSIPLHRTASLMPFLGPAALTMAGCIVWHIVDAAGSAQKHGRIPGPALPARLQIVAYFSQSPPPLQNMGPEQWASMIDSFLEASCQGTAPMAPSPEKIAKEVAVRWRQHQWLTALDVQQRIRTAVGESVFSMLTAPMSERCEIEMTRIRNGDFGATRQANEPLFGSMSDAMDGLLDMLAETYICFGNGPRWNSETLDDALKNWCASVILRAQPAAFQSNTGGFNFRTES